MKDMKCRVWNPHTKEMVYLPTLIVDEYSIGFATEDEFYVDINNHHPTPDLEVTWWTGITDKNGKDIYEDDVVNINHPQDLTGDFTNKPGLVFWWDSEASFYHGHESVKGGSGRPPKRMWEYCEVIGNIYENPELVAKS